MDNLIMSLLQNIALLVVTVCLSEAYPSGAPPFACTEMVPGHPKTNTSGSPPYKVDIDIASYKPGSIITGTIKATSNVTFRGFLIQARSALNDSPVPLGTFIDPVKLTHTQCGDDSKQGLTHSNNTNKSSVKFTWKAPSNYAGDIVFRVTIVETFDPSRYWLNILSDTILDCSLHSNDSECADITTDAPPAEPTGTAPTSPQTTSTGPTGTITKDPQCGVTKGCFSDCSDSSCSYQVTWQATPDKSSVLFDMKVKMDSTDDVWIAAGISPNGKMSGTTVMACLSQSSGVAMQSSVNQGYSNQVFKDASYGLSKAQGQVIDGIVHCSVSRRTSMPDPQFMNLSTKHYLLVGNGPVVSGFISKHYQIPYKTENEVDFLSTGVASADTSVSTLIKVHASMMILAWVFFSSVGVVAARHCKDMLAHKLYMGVKAWFLVHRPAMIFATLCLIAGFIAIFVEVKRFSDKPAGPDYTEAHPFLGIVVAALTLLNPIMAMCRPSPDSKNRYIFNWAHFGVGTTAHVAAIVTIFLGLKLEKVRANKGAFYVMVAYAACFLLVQAILEIGGKNREHLIGYETPENSYAPGVGPLSATADSSMSTSLVLSKVPEKRLPSGFTGGMLFLHGLIMLGLAGFLIAIICVPIHLL